MLRYLLSEKQSSSELMDYGYEYSQKTSKINSDRKLQSFSAFHIAGNNYQQTQGLRFTPCFVTGADGDYFAEKEDYTFDKLVTSPRRAFGDHDCFHTKIDARLERDSARSHWVNLADPEKSTERIFDFPLPMASVTHFGRDNIMLPRTKTAIDLMDNNACQISLPLNYLPCYDVGVEYEADCTSALDFHDWRVLTRRYPLITGSYQGCIPVSYTRLNQFEYIKYGFNTHISTTKLPGRGTTQLYYCLVCTSAKVEWKAKFNLSPRTQSRFYSYRENAIMLSYGVDKYSGCAEVNVYRIPTTMSSKYADLRFLEETLSGKTSVTGDVSTCEYYSSKKRMLHDEVQEALDLKVYYGTYIPAFNSSIPRTAWYYSTKPTQRNSPGLTQPEMAAARNYLWQTYRHFWDDKPEASSHDRGNVAYEATKCVQALDINSLAFAKDLPSLIVSVKEVIRLLAEIKNPPKLAKDIFNAKFWSNLYLQYRYGITLTAKDTKTIVKSIAKELEVAKGINGVFQFVNARKFVSLPYGNRILTYKIYYNPYDKGILGLLRKLQDWDMYPVLSNDWDLIPFSFIADWFVDVGTLLDKSDTVNYWQYLRINSCVWSCKDVAQPISTRVKITGVDIAFSSLLLSRYHRNVQGNPDLPSFDLNNGSGLSSKHILDAGAIIIQR